MPDASKLSTEKLTSATVSELAALILRLLRRNQATRRSELRLDYPRNSLLSIIETEVVNSSLEQLAPEVQVKCRDAIAYLWDRKLIEVDPKDRLEDRVRVSSQGWVADTTLIQTFDDQFCLHSSSQRNSSYPHAWSLIAHRDLDDRLLWGIRSSEDEDSERSVTITVKLRFRGQIDIARVTGIVKRLLGSNEVCWLSTSSAPWIVDLAKLREEFAVLCPVEWLLGKAAVTPQISIETDMIVTHLTQTLELPQVMELTFASLQIYLTPQTRRTASTRAKDHQSVVIVETDLAEQPGYVGEMKQGTAFELERVGLVTCAHVLTDHMVAYRATHPHEKFPVDVRLVDPSLDVAVLSSPISEQLTGLRRGSSDALEVGDEVVLVGFPDHGEGDTGIVSYGKLLGSRRRNGIAYLLVDAVIAEGNSGGPVLNSRGEVIGIAMTGARTVGTVDDDADRRVLPIELLGFLPLPGGDV